MVRPCRKLSGGNDSSTPSLVSVQTKFAFMLGYEVVAIRASVRIVASQCGPMVCGVGQTVDQQCATHVHTTGFLSGAGVDP